MICWIDWGLPPPCSCCTANALLLSIDIATTRSASEEGRTPLRRQLKAAPGHRQGDGPTIYEAVGPLAEPSCIVGPPPEALTSGRHRPPLAGGPTLDATAH